MYKKSIIFLCLLACMANGQVSKNRLKQPTYSWIGRTVPTNSFLDSTFKSFWNKVDDGTPLTPGTGWGLSGNAASSYSSFIGTTNNKSLRFLVTCTNIPVFKIDSMTNCATPEGGWKHFYSYGVPSSGEMNEFVVDLRANPTLTSNLYGIRSSVLFNSSVDNSAERIAAMLGSSDLQSTHTGTLGWNVGVYGKVYDMGSGLTLRNIANYHVASNRGTGTVTAQYGNYVQTEAQSGLTVNNFGEYIRAPMITTGTINTNYGLYVATQTVSGGTGYAIYGEGVDDLSYLAGHLTVNKNIISNGSQTVVSSVTTPSIIGGSALTSSITYIATTNTAAASTSIGHSFKVGNNGGTQGPMILKNGNFVIPQNTTILGLDGGGTSRNLLAWQGDNILINGVPGSSDISINPTSSGSGLVVKSAGRVGVNLASPTAKLHLPSGASNASNGPLKFTVSGSALQTTPEQGVVETDANGTLYYCPANSVRYQVGTVLTNTATLDIPSTLPASVSDVTMTVTGAATGDAVTLGIPTAAIVTGGIFSVAWVSASNVVTIRFYNSDIVSQNPGSGTFKATVIKN